MMARWEAGPREKQPKVLKGELENNSKKPRDLVWKLLNDSLKNINLRTVSQGKKKKGDEVADDDDDDDVVWASVSQNWETEWQQHHVLRNYSSALSI